MPSLPDQNFPEQARTRQPAPHLLSRKSRKTDQKYRRIRRVRRKRQIRSNVVIAVSPLSVDPWAQSRPDADALAAFVLGRDADVAHEGKVRRRIGERRGRPRWAGVLGSGLAIMGGGATQRRPPAGRLHRSAATSPFRLTSGFVGIIWISSSYRSILPLS